MKVNYATISNNANRVKGINLSNFVGSLQYCPSDPRVVIFLAKPKNSSSNVEIKRNANWQYMHTELY